MVFDNWSDNSSTIATLSRQSIKNEVGAVADVCRKERSKTSITISVVREQGLKKLERACEYTRRFFKKEAPPMLFTTAEDLQGTIDTIQFSTKHSTLNLLVSQNVPEISFHVPSRFSQLKVLRCVKHRDGGRLFVDGSSTYNNVRLDKWQAHRHKNHDLVIGHENGVRIKLTDIVNLSNWAQSRSNFSESEEAELRELFGALSDKSRWDKVKGTVAAIVGIAVGTVKLGVSLSGAAGGIYVKYAFGFHALELGMAGAKLTTVATAAGSAVLLGVGAAAVVYFVPWESLFKWLKRALFNLWDQICVVWERFKDWVMSLFASESQPKMSMVAVPRAMEFFG